VTVVAIPGVNASTGQLLLSDNGLDLRQWLHAKGCGAWLGLAPHHAISGENVWRRRTLKTCNCADQALPLAAQAAIVATAHTFARMVYYRLTHRIPYRDLSAADYEQHIRGQDLASLRKNAVGHGLTLVESPA
jgi:hypothetical protein